MKHKTKTWGMEAPIVIIETIDIGQNGDYEVKELSEKEAAKIRKRFKDASK